MIFYLPALVLVQGGDFFCKDGASGLLPSAQMPKKQTFRSGRRVPSGRWVVAPVGKDGK